VTVLVVVGLSSLYAVAAASADTIYRFIDRAGVIHFSNAPTDARYKKIDVTRAPVRRSPLTVPSPALHETIQRVAHQHRLNPALVHAVIRVESGYDPNALSPKGAMGLMQLMPDTASLLNVSNPYNPEDNVAAGTGYLRYLLDRFGGNLPLALAAYNAGESRVLRDNQIPRIRETQHYVQKVLLLYQEGLRERRS